MHGRRAWPAILLIVAASCVVAPAAERFVWFGTYTNDKTGSRGIYVSRFDDRSGSLDPPRLAAEARNPAFLALHPRLPVLGCISEEPAAEARPASGITTFAVDGSTGLLDRIASQPSGGRGACHVAFDHEGKVVLAANYGDGTVACLGVEPDGGLRPLITGTPGGFVAHAREIRDEPGVKPGRQEGPHAHCVEVVPDGRFVVVCDLGRDEVLVHALDRGRAVLAPHAAVKLQAGAGPRHFALHPDGRRAWCVNELDLTVTGFAWDRQAGTLTTGETVSTLPADVVERQGYSTAEIAVHPNGRFLYASNRGHDSIAVFTIDPFTGRLAFEDVEPIRGRRPRHFAIDPTGRLLLAAGQDSNTVTVFAIDDETGRLSFTGTTIDVPCPVCIVFDRGAAAAGGAEPAP